MSEHGVVPEPPPAFDVVPVEVARPVLEEVRGAIDALERRLAHAVQEADDAEIEASRANADVPGADLVDALQRLAVSLRSGADAYAEQVRHAAAEQAGQLRASYGERPSSNGSGTI